MLFRQRAQASACAIADDRVAKPFGGRKAITGQGGYFFCFLENKAGRDKTDTTGSRAQEIPADKKTVLFCLRRQASHDPVHDEPR